MKKIFQKIHLWMSIPVGLIISIICLSGAALVFERDITQVLNPHLYKVKYEKGATPLSPSQLVDRIYQQVPDSLEVMSLQLTSERDAACMVTFKGMGKRSLSVNPYTGEVNGWTKSYPFFQTMRKLHRWLMNPPAYKGAQSTGKMIVGITTLIMVPILISGIFLWIPHTRKALRNRLSVSFSKGWRRFWYDSHISLGIYSVLFLLVMALTGLTWSFQWYRTFAYGLFGASTTRPATSLANSKKEEKKAAKRFDYAVWDKVVAEIEGRYSSPASLLLTTKDVQINTSGNRNDRNTALFDTETGAIKSVKTYKDEPQAQKLKGWFYSFHTGLWGGMTTKVLYFLAAFIGGFLPLSGYYFWIKKKYFSVKRRS